MIDEAFVQRFSSYFIVKSRSKYQNELQNRSQELYKCTQTTSFFIAMWLFLLTCICTIKYANHDVFVRFGWYKRLDEYALSVLILKTKPEPCIANKRMKMLEENRALQKKRVKGKRNQDWWHRYRRQNHRFNRNVQSTKTKSNRKFGDVLKLNGLWCVESSINNHKIFLRILDSHLHCDTFLDSSLSAMNMLSFDSQPPLFQSQAHW